MNHFEYGFYDELEKLAAQKGMLDFKNRISPKRIKAVIKGAVKGGFVGMAPGQEQSGILPLGTVAGLATDHPKSVAGAAGLAAFLPGAIKGAREEMASQDARKEKAAQRVGGMNKSAAEGKLTKMTADILSSPTGAPETLKDELLDTVLGLGGGFAGSRIGRLVGRDDETGLSIGGNLGALVGGLAGPSITRAIRYDRKLKEQGRKAKVSRLKAGAITGLLGAALGASLPTVSGDAKERLLHAISLGIPAAGIGAGAPAIFGTAKA